MVRLNLMKWTISIVIVLNLYKSGPVKTGPTGLVAPALRNITFSQAVAILCQESYKQLSYTRTCRIDYSWAMLHSVCNSFNKQTLEDYLSTSWQVIHVPKSTTPPKTIIHICSAHIMNRLSYKLTRKFRIDKLLKEKSCL